MDEFMVRYVIGQHDRYVMIFEHGQFTKPVLVVDERAFKKMIKDFQELKKEMTERYPEKH